MEDISPYATFQISDPKKFHEESFSQEIVVAKFHPVMHGLPRGSRDKWIDRDPRQMPDSEDSESENTQRYSVIPSQQRPRLSNPYQINAPHQPPPPLPYHPSSFQHLHQEQEGDTSDCEDCDSSSSDPSKRTIDRRTSQKDRCFHDMILSLYGLSYTVTYTRFYFFAEKEEEEVRRLIGNTRGLREVGGS